MKGRSHTGRKFHAKNIHKILIDVDELTLPKPRFDYASMHRRRGLDFSSISGNSTGSFHGPVK